jgi:transcriptional regulator with XRE-family HTH domain
MSKLTDLISAKRTEKGWSKRELASQTANFHTPVSHSEIHRIENGERENPSVPILLAIARALGIPTEDILVAAGYTDSQQSALQKAFPNLNSPQLDATQKVADILARNDDFSTQDAEEVVRFVEALINAKKK